MYLIKKKMLERFKKLFGKKNYRSGIFLVIYKKERGRRVQYLLLQRKLHWKGWEFTKGGIEKGESELEAIKRELKEECGLKLISFQEYKKKGRYVYDKKTARGRGKQGQTYKLFSARVKPGKVKIDKLEHSGYRWVGFKRAMELLTWENQRGCLRVVDRKIS